MKTCNYCKNYSCCELKEIRESNEYCSYYEEIEPIKEQMEMEDGSFFNRFKFKIPIGNQEFEMCIEQFDETLDTKYYYIYMAVYNKRGNIDKFIEKASATGMRPAETLGAMTFAFRSLEQAVISQYTNKKISISITWADNQRRDIYYRYLKRFGYNFGRCDKTKVLYKIYEKEVN